LSTGLWGPPPPPPPTAPSPSTVTITKPRSSIRPKLVSKKRTSGRRRSRSSIRSIRTRQCYRNRSSGFAILRSPREAASRARLSSTLDFRYIAIEGPAGVGKSLLADRLGSRLDATVVLDETENPFLADFYADRPGAAFQAQLFFTLSRHRQQTALRQSDLFSQLTVCDYVFDRDKIYAYLNLDDNELFIYQRLYELLAQDIPTPDLVIFLQTPTDVLRRRLRDRERANPDVPPLDDEYVRELNEAYNHFFFHYTATPLLVVETSQFDLSWGEDALADLERQLRSMGRGTRYYVPRK
jgi:deoxyguanosine kinase